MPVRTATDETLRTAWRRVAHLWQPMAGWTLLVWAALAVVLVPLSSGLLGRALVRGDRPVVGNEELLAWLLSPLGITWALLAGGLALIAAVVRYAGIFCIVTDDMEGRQPSVRRTALELAPHLPTLFPLCVKTVIAGGLMVLPLAAGLGAVYALLLGRYDINYYLSVQPAEWYVALGVGGVWAAVWAVAAGYVAGRSILALPAYLDGYAPLRTAVRRSWERTRGNAGRLVRLMVFAVVAWILVRFVLNAMILATASVSMDWVASMFASLRPILMTTGLFAGASFAVDAVVSFLGFAFLATVLTKFYLEDTGLHATAPAPPTGADIRSRTAATTRRWLHPARLLPLAVLVAATSLVGSAFLLDPVVEPQPVAIHAHRAGPPPSPENTLSALERAIAAGADYSEIDVQRTQDGTLVIVHDADFMRVAGDPRRVADVTYAEIMGLVQQPADDTPASERRIATLGHFMERAQGRIKLNIELKYYGPDPDLADAVVRQVLAHDMADDVVLMSLSLEAVERIRALAPEIRTGYVSAVAVGDVSRLPVDFLAIAQHRATPRLIRAAHERGIAVYPWTVNRADAMAALMERGVDGIITDDPALAFRVRQELAKLSPAGWLLLRFRGLLLD